MLSRTTSFLASLIALAGVSACSTTYSDVYSYKKTSFKAPPAPKQAIIAPPTPITDPFAGQPTGIPGADPAATAIPGIPGLDTNPPGAAPETTPAPVPGAEMTPPPTGTPAPDPGAAPIPGL